MKRILEIDCLACCNECGEWRTYVSGIEWYSSACGMFAWMMCYRKYFWRLSEYKSGIKFEIFKMAIELTYLRPSLRKIPQFHQILQQRIVCSQFWAIPPKLYGNFAFPQIFNSRKLHSLFYKNNFIRTRASHLTKS